MQAAEYFRDLEMLLCDLKSLLEMINRGMVSLAEEYRASFPKSRLILDPKERGDRPLPTALYWAVWCKRKKKLLEVRLPGTVSGRQYLKVHLPRKRLDHDLVFLVAREAGREDLIWEFDRRAAATNAAARRVGNALMSIESILLARSDRRKWEGGDIQVDAPQISADL